MKKRYYKYFTVLGIVGMMYSCKSDLETEPIELQTLDEIFSRMDSAGVNAERFLADFYPYLPSTGNRVGDDYLDAATDDAISSNTANVSVQQLSMGTYTAENYPNNQWALNYKGIRQANIFINNIDKVPLKGRLSNGTSFNRVWKAEAKFLRAMFYFELVKRHGGVPLLMDKVYQINDNIELPRNSFQECIDYLISECDVIKDSLRVDPFNLPFYGRPTKSAAMALKARILLYAASPLYNGGNIDPANPLTGYTDYAVERWTKAEQAAKDVIDLTLFSLEPEFKSVFITRNQERIFSKQGSNNTGVENANGPVGYSVGINNGRTSPTQELVDAFGMANGQSVDANNPYQGRDKRFYATIFYNGAMWLNRPVQTYEGGADRPGGTRQQTRTGYYSRKFMGNFETANSYSNVNHDHILFRYAEILLNYAEARNEVLSAPDQEVYTAVEAIRERAGLVPFKLADDLSQEDMKEIIKNERRKELAFEEHRFYDVRRWKDAETVFNKQLHGVVIYQTGTGTIRQEVPVSKINFEKRMYLAPIPFYEVLKNPNMVQNPGW